jgi:5-methylcytosine-specific restriction endonuclease McrA
MAQRYLRFEIVPVEVVTAEILANWAEREAHVQRPSGLWVSVSSLRMKTFGRAAQSSTGLECVTCGIKGLFYAVEQSPGQKSHHLNLYGVNEDSEEVLMTHDHIIARGLGGVDNLSNAQVMCSPCNSKKGKVEAKEAERRRKLTEKEQNAKTDDQI